MKLAKVYGFMRPRLGMSVIEGWVAMVYNRPGGVMIKKLLISEDEELYKGIVVADSEEDAMEVDGFEISGGSRLDNGLHVFGVRGELNLIANQWTSELPDPDKPQFVIAPYRAEAIALLDGRGRWWVPWLLMFLPRSANIRHEAA